MHPILIAALHLSFAFQTPATASCDTASTTRSNETCLQQQSRAKDDTLRRLEAVVRAQLDKTAARSFDSAVAAWSTYRTRACNAVYDFWRQGTIRNSEYLGCVLDLTDERIAHLASTYFPPSGLPRDSIARVLSRHGARR